MLRMFTALLAWIARSHSIGAALARWRAGTTTNSQTSVLFDPKCQALSGGLDEPSQDHAGDLLRFSRQFRPARLPLDSDCLD